MSTVDLGLISFKNVDNAPLAGDVDETTINHDNLLNFVADEHIDHSAVVLSAGNGISAAGLGDLTASRTIALTDTAVSPGPFGSSSSTSSITVDQQGRITAAANTPIDHDALTNYVANEHIDWTNATQALSTSGNITASGAAVGEFGSIRIGSSGSRPLELSSTAANEAKVLMGGSDVMRILRVGSLNILTISANTTAISGALSAANISTATTSTVTIRGALRVENAPITNGVLQSVDASGLIGYTLVSATNMADNGVVGGTYGTAATVPAVTVDSKGLVTSISNVSIDHDALTNYVANEHIDWTAATNPFQTSVDSAAAFQVRTAGGVNQLAVNTSVPNVAISAPLTYTGSTPGNGFTLLSDAAGNASWVSPRMADIHWSNNATVTNVTPADTFVKAAVGAGLSVLNPAALGSWSLNASENRLQYTSAATGVMHGGCTLSLNGGNGKTFQAAIYKNSALVPGSVVQFSTSNATSNTSTAIHFMTAVATNDFFELWISGVGTTDTPTVQFANIFAVVMGR